MQDTEDAPGLGQFLGIAISVDDPAGALAAFTGLGLREAPVGDLEAAPRAVVSDGRLSIGLHDPGFEGPVPVFVRPDLRRQVPRLEAAGVSIEHASLADDRFHRVAFRDPGGLEIVMLEARTFPPVEPDPVVVSACGHFEELSIAAGTLDDSLSFWRSLGFDVVAESSSPYRRVRLDGFGLAVGLHETSGFTAGLSFRAPGVDARIEYLRAKGHEPRRSSPLAGAAATLVSPGGVPLFLRDVDDEEAADETA